MEDFHRGLLWQGHDRIIHPEVGFSWSWAVTSDGNKLEGVYDIINFSSLLDGQEEAELLGLAIENVDNNPYGQVISASITLRGFCHKLNSLLGAHIFHYENGRYEGYLLNNKDYLPFPREQVQATVPRINGSVYGCHG